MSSVSLMENSTTAGRATSNVGWVAINWGWHVPSEHLSSIPLMTDRGWHRMQTRGGCCSRHSQSPSGTSWSLSQGLHWVSSKWITAFSFMFIFYRVLPLSSLSVRLAVECRGDGLLSQLPCTVPGGDPGTPGRDTAATCFTKMPCGARTLPVRSRRESE